MQARSLGPPNQAVCPRGRGPRPGACVPSFLALRKLVLALPRQFIWTLELKEGTARHSRVPPQGGHHWGEHGVRTTGLSKMTDANNRWPFIRGSHTSPCAYIVSLSLDSSPASWRFRPIVQTGTPRHRGVSPLPGASEAGEEGLGSGPTPGRGPSVLRPTDPHGALGWMPLLMPKEVAQLTGQGVGGWGLIPGLHPEPSDPELGKTLLFSSLPPVPPSGRRRAALAAPARVRWQELCQEPGGRSCQGCHGGRGGSSGMPMWVSGSRPGVAGRRRRPLLPTSGSPPQSRGPFFSLRGSRHPRQLGNSKAVDAVPGGEATVSPSLGPLGQGLPSPLRGHSTSRSHDCSLSRAAASPPQAPRPPPHLLLPPPVTLPGTHLAHAGPHRACMALAAVWPGGHLPPLDLTRL